MSSHDEVILCLLMMRSYHVYPCFGPTISTNDEVIPCLPLLRSYHVSTYVEVVPWKGEVSHLKPVPGCVLHEPVSSGAVVDEDHEGDGDASERIERSKPLLGRRRLRRRRWWWRRILA